EWGRAVTRSPDVEANAASQLADAPAPMHDRVGRALMAPGASPRARRLGAEVLLTWGQPTQAWAALEPTLGVADTDSPGALRRFADLAGSLTTPEGHRVRAPRRYASCWMAGTKSRPDACSKRIRTRTGSRRPRSSSC